jgi:hypothetical protein
MFEFKRWLEMSYTQQDVPNCYFLCPTLDPQKLATKTLHGVQGISANGIAILPFYKGVLLIMKGSLTEQLNKLSRIQYENPHYLSSRGQEGLMRVVGGVPRNFFYEMINTAIIDFSSSEDDDKLPPWFKGTGEGVGYDLVSKVFDILDKSKLEKAPDFNSLVKTIYSAIIKANPDLAKTPISKLSNFIKQAMMVGTKDYTKEKEWRVKPEYNRDDSGQIKQVPILKIHDGSLLWVDPKHQQKIEESQLD